MAATQESIEREPKHKIILQGQGQSQRFTEQLVILWEEKQFSDVVLKANDGKEFPCHRVVLAAASSYFKAMFNSGMVESCSRTVELEKMDSDILSSLIRYMYSGSLKITADNAQRLVESCKPLDLAEVITGCEDFMVQEQCPTNCLGFKRFAELYELKRLKEAAESTMLKNFSGVVRSTEFGELSVQEVMDYISFSELKVKTEDPVFEAVSMWVRVDPVNREALFHKIASKVRFPFCTKTYLSSVVVPSPYMSNPECAAYLQEACTYHMLPEQRKRMSSPRLVPREDFHTYSVVVIFGGVTKEGTANENGAYRCQGKGDWTQITRFNGNGLRDYAVVPFQNGIFVTGGVENDSLQQNCFLYDLKVHEWRDMPLMMEGRSHHGSVVQDGNVYVLGGKSRPILSPKMSVNTVEVYNKVHGCWTSAVAMPKVLTRPLSISYGRFIFVTSGERKGVDSVTTMVYDTVWDRWEYRKQMPRAVRRGSITGLEDKIYVVGGVLPSCLSYDMAVDAWTVLTPPNRAHGSAPSIVMTGDIMIYGGTDAAGKLSSIVERYNPKTDTWSRSVKKQLPRAYHHFMCVDMLM